MGLGITPSWKVMWNSNVECVISLRHLQLNHSFPGIRLVVHPNVKNLPVICRCLMCSIMTDWNTLFSISLRKIMAFVTVQILVRSENGRYLKTDFFVSLCKCGSMCIIRGLVCVCACGSVCLCLSLLYQGQIKLQFIQ